MPTQQPYPAATSSCTRCVCRNTAWHPGEQLSLLTSRPPVPAQGWFCTSTSLLCRSAAAPSAPRAIGGSTAGDLLGWLQWETPFLLPPPHTAAPAAAWAAWEVQSPFPNCAPLTLTSTRKEERDHTKSSAAFLFQVSARIGSRASPQPQAVPLHTLVHEQAYFPSKPM